MSDYTPTTEEVRNAFSDYMEDDAGGWFKAQAGFDRWLAEVSREERKAERKGIMDLLEEMIKLASNDDELDGLCAFREALWERNDK